MMNSVPRDGGGCHRFEEAVDARERAKEELHDKFLRKLAEGTAAKAANG